MSGMDFVIRNRIRETGLSLEEWRAIIEEHKSECAVCGNKSMEANLFPGLVDGKYVPICAMCRGRR